MKRILQIFRWPTKRFGKETQTKDPVTGPVQNLILLFCCRCFVLFCFVLKKTFLALPFWRGTFSVRLSFVAAVVVSRIVIPLITTQVPVVNYCVFHREPPKFQLSLIGIGYSLVVESMNCCRRSFHWPS